MNFNSMDSFAKYDGDFFLIKVNGKVFPAALFDSWTRRIRYFDTNRITTCFVHPDEAEGWLPLDATQVEILSKIVGMSMKDPSYREMYNIAVDFGRQVDELQSKLDKTEKALAEKTRAYDGMYECAIRNGRIADSNTGEVRRLQQENAKIQEKLDFADKRAVKNAKLADQFEKSNRELRQENSNLRLELGNKCGEAHDLLRKLKEANLRAAVADERLAAANCKSLSLENSVAEKDKTIEELRRKLCGQAALLTQLLIMNRSLAVKHPEMHSLLEVNQTLRKENQDLSLRLNLLKIVFDEIEKCIEDGEKENEDLRQENETLKKRSEELAIESALPANFLRAIKSNP